jgi:hypothetical protein
LIPAKLPQTFWDVLSDHGGNWISENLHFDNDTSVEWMLAALTNGALLWVTNDGSHSSKCAPDISGAGTQHQIDRGLAHSMKYQNT